MHLGDPAKVNQKHQSRHRHADELAQHRRPAHRRSDAPGDIADALIHGGGIAGQADSGQGRNGRKQHAHKAAHHHHAAQECEQQRQPRHDGACEQIPLFQHAAQHLLGPRKAVQKGTRQRTEGREQRIGLPRGGLAVTVGLLESRRIGSLLILRIGLPVEVLLLRIGLLLRAHIRLLCRGRRLHALRPAHGRLHTHAGTRRRISLGHALSITRHVTRLDIGGKRLVADGAKRRALRDRGSALGTVHIVPPSKRSMGIRSIIARAGARVNPLPQGHRG